MRKKSEEIEIRDKTKRGKKQQRMRLVMKRKEKEDQRFNRRGNVREVFFETTARVFLKSDDPFPSSSSKKKEKKEEKKKKAKRKETGWLTRERRVAGKERTRGRERTRGKVRGRADAHGEEEIPTRKYAFEEGVRERDIERFTGRGTAEFDSVKTKERTTS